MFADLEGDEETHDETPESQEQVSRNVTAIGSTVQLDGPFVLAPNESQTFRGDFLMPVGSPPSFVGRIDGAASRVRVRVEAFGNEPDSGILPVTAGAR